MSISAGDILEQLDDAAREYEFPVLDNGYVYFGATRLTCYRSDDDWAIVFEVLGYFTRERMFENRLYVFGSCIANRGIGNYLVPFEPHGSADEADFIPSDLRAVTIRGSRYELAIDSDVFERAGIRRKSMTSVHASELLRLLISLKLDDLWATEEELRLATGVQLSKVLILDEWEHPDVSAEQLPSETSTFRMLASALSSGDAGMYDANQISPNTHWKNWPEAGLL